MGNFFKNNLNFQKLEISDYSTNLKTRTSIRAKQTSLFCNSCNVPLMPVSINKTNFPFYCKYCSENSKLQDSHGIGMYIHPEDIWVSKKYKNENFN